MLDFKNEVVKMDVSVIDYWMRKLNHTEFKIFLLIYRRTVSTGKIYERVSQIEMANISGVTTRSIGTALKSLEVMGLVKSSGSVKAAKVFSINLDIVHNVCLDINNFEDKTNRAFRGKITQALRVAVFENDAYRCIKCDSHKMLEVDHIIPVSKGGSNEPNNLQTLCNPCNNSKGVKDMEDWTKE